ncbi:MAG: hypothetical protein LBC45_04650 [Chlamydiales bacterium]|jgi:hypothetical protein|nr:hypothetical protein [Chlamydiales bacterium]
MNIVSTGYRVFSEAMNLGRDLSPTTGAMLAAATAVASVQIAPASGVLVLGGTLLGAYYHAKKDIKLNMIHNATKEIRDLVPDLSSITDRAKINALEFKAMYEDVKHFLPKVDERLDEQEAQLVQQGNILQAVKRYHDEWAWIDNRLKSLKEQENRLIGHIDRLEELENRRQKEGKRNRERMIRWNHLVEKLKQCKGSDKEEIVQEVCREIGDLTKEIYGEKALHKTSMLNLQTTEVVEKNHRSSCQIRTEAATKPTFQSKALNCIPLTRDRVSLHRQIG